MNGDKQIEIDTHSEDKYPYNFYVVAGSQAFKWTENRLYVMNWCNLTNTLEEDFDEDVIKEGEDDDDTTLYYEGVPHKGAVNRLRTLHGSSIVATWGDEGDVSIYDLKEAITRVD